MQTSVRELEVLTEKDLAAVLQMQPQSLADWRHRGFGPRYLKLGHMIRYRPTDINAWFDVNTGGGAP
jgi:hypothetical protein